MEEGKGGRWIEKSVDKGLREKMENRRRRDSDHVLIKHMDINILPS